MSDVARKGDRCYGTCYHPSHKNPLTTYAVIIEGTLTTDLGDKSIACVGDLVRTDCGHYGVIITGSDVVTVEYSPVARRGDQVSNINGTHFIGTIIEGYDGIVIP